MVAVAISVSRSGILRAVLQGVNRLLGNDERVFQLTHLRAQLFDLSDQPSQAAVHARLRGRECGVLEHLLLDLVQSVSHGRLPSTHSVQEGELRNPRRGVTSQRSRAPY